MSRRRKPQPLLTTKDVAELLQIPVKTLNNWRVDGGGPRFCRVHSKAIRYRLEDVEAWIAERVMNHTSEVP